MRRLLARIAGRAVEQPALALALCLLAVVIVGAGALRLQPTAATDSLVDSGSEAFAATEDFKREFGDDAVVVLVRGDLTRLLLTENLQTLLGLERCLGGQLAGGDATSGGSATTAGASGGGGQASASGTAAPATGAGAVPEPCAALAESGAVRAVYGPAGFLDQFVEQSTKLLDQEAQAIQRRAAEAYEAARQRLLEAGVPAAQADATARAAAEQFYSQLQGQFFQQGLELATRYNLNPGLPSLDDPAFVQGVFFDQSQPDPTPKSRFSYLVPSDDAALISIRLRSELSDEQRREAIGLIREATEDPAFELGGGDYVVSGVPVLVDGLAEKLSTEILLLGGVAVAVMALALVLLLGSPLRLLPLAVALGAAAVAFGLLALTGGTLTLASLAVLPILIGLGVDYAIQFQARFAEALADGASPPRAAVEAASRGGPVIGAAVLATAAGFLALLLSPIPMIRTFALILVLGTLVAYAIALTAGLAALSLSGRRRRAAPRRAAGRLGELRATAATQLERLRGATRARVRRLGRATLARAIASPGAVLATAAILAGAGWALDTRTEVVSDLRELVPSDLPAIEGVDALEQETGISGEIDVTVTADDLSDPEVVAWMADLQDRVLAAGGFDAEETCASGETDLCPAASLPDILASSGRVPDERTIDSILGLLPPRFAQAVIETDPESGEYGDTAVIAFGIRVMPFDEQSALIDRIRAEIEADGGPPPGVEAQVVGLPVLAADANGELSGNRYLLAGVGLLLVALVLLALYRSPRRALVPLLPIVLATGWAGLVFALVDLVLGGLGLLDVALNPMSATLGALVIAIATEFSVLLSSRYHEERDAGLSIAESLRRAYSRTGTAVLASGLTAIAGFATLLATDIPMLRDFGLVTVLDLLVALAGVMVVLPAALVWAERRGAAARGPLRLRRPRAAGRAEPG